MFHESEMALFSECTPECARIVLDTADIVREAMLRQLNHHAGLETLNVRFNFIVNKLANTDVLWGFVLF